MKDVYKYFIQHRFNFKVSTNLSYFFKDKVSCKKFKVKVLFHLLTLITAFKTFIFRLIY